ncbi:asparagine synthase [Sphingomonas psychrotolerans]|uniref:Asparagine synthase n=1 Tax=Sphingomonas psychrotolerans TaxID=1327635 RepID=A0A2K8MMV0_9SPHN|nr:asparagine synthase [Sphingomonas psychrotolerans]
MFHARLEFDDLTSPIDLIDGGLFLGRSRIFPVRHRLLRTDVLESDDRIAIVSCERFADDLEGIGLSRLSDSALQDRLAELEEHLLDFAVLTIDRRRRTISYRASPMVSIPIYLLADQGGVSVDWDYARLLGTREVEIVWEIALAQIAGLSTYGPTTIVAGMHRATAGATLTASMRGVDVELPVAVDHDGPHEISPGADIESRLFEAVKAIIEARPFDPSRTAVELSGGMDSALTSIAAASVAGPGLMSLGAQFDGEMGAAQRERRAMLREYGGFDDLSIPAERFAPFSPASLRRNRYGVWPEDENYPEMFEAMFGMLQAAGIDTIVSGLGGDELYIAYQGEEGAPGPDGPPACPFLTDRGQVIANGARSRYPTGWLQETCWSGAASQSQRVLRYGLWPIHPYHNPLLARFVSRLPRSYRRDRRLLRDTLSKLLGNQVFAADYVKETFKPVALRGIAENRDYLIDLLRRSRLSQHPDIEDRAILAALSGDIGALDPDTYNALFRVLKIFCFFQ